MGWHTDSGSVLERCVTRRIRVTLSPAAFLTAVDPQTVGLLLAKRIVWEGARSGAASDRDAAAKLRAAIGKGFCDPAVILL